MSNDILLIHKPVGLTSHDVVDCVRKKLGIRRVGHAGTLDPFAEGLLIVLVGRENTRRQSEFLNMDKEYEAIIRLGARSTTDDPTGEITECASCKKIDPASLEHVLSSFVGIYAQVPSSFSAKKIKGKKAYELAREGISFELKPKDITISSLELLAYQWPYATILTTVSSGTYIRALARDIGEKLGCGAYVEKLKRTRIGPYTISQAVKLDELVS
jgi:tRNA pseudouridine55 synthase